MKPGLLKSNALSKKGFIAPQIIYNFYRGDEI